MLIIDTDQAALEDEVGDSIPGNTTKTEPDIEWTGLRSLAPQLHPVEPFDLRLLPKSLRGWIKDISERMDNQHYDYAAVAAMCCLGSLLGRKVGIHPKQYDPWMVIANLWGLVVGRPSAKKTPSLSEVMKALERLAIEARKVHANEQKDFDAQAVLSKLKAKDSEKKAAAMVKDGKIDEAKILLLGDGVETEKPTVKRYYVNDTSIEKLGELLAENPTGILQYRDEVNGWMKAMDREDRGSDRAFYLEAFSGLGSFTYDRIGRGTVHIPSVTISLLGGIQPGKLQPYLMSQRDGSGDDGLLQRMQVMVYPDQCKFKHVDRWPDKEAKNTAYEVFERFDAIPESEEEIPALRFSPDAQQLFNEWYCELMQRCRSGSDTEHMEAHLSKYASLMPSLALIIHVADHGHVGNVGLESSQMAAAWCEYLETHARRVYGLLDDPFYGARSLAGKLDKLDNPFNAADIRNRDWRGLRSAEDRKNALTTLLDTGHLHSEQIDTGNKTKIVYFINPKVLECSDG